MKWGGLFIFCLFSLACWAQPGGPIRYSRPMARLEVNLIGSFAYGINQGAIDMDSAVALFCEREGLDRELYYEENYADRTMSPRIRVLLRQGAGYLFRPGMRSADMDSAVLLLKHALALGDSLKDGNGRLAALTLLGKYYFQKGDFREAETIFRRLLRPAGRRGMEGARRWRWRTGASMLI